MLDELRSERIKKLNLLRENGKNPYPALTKRDASIESVLKNFPELEESKNPTSIAGRVLSLREHGGILFCDLSDGTGKIQILLKKDTLFELYELFISSVDIGDFIETAGVAFKTKRGEMTIEVSEWSMLTKSLLPLPEKWHGLQDTEERYRKRYLDILMSSHVKDMFVKKAKFWKSTREFLQSHGFMEVETPVLESSPGGADAEPFLTHLNALDIDLYLRISPELYLKRLMVAGFEKVFEIGRIFRNEGIDKEHLQDYTQLEFYWGYADYRMLMEFVEDMYKKIIMDTIGSLKHQWNGQTINWGGKWKIYDYYEAMKEHAGIDLKTASDTDLRAIATKLGLDAEKHHGRGRVIDLIFKKAVRSHMIQPGFLINPPLDVEPLAKRMESDPDKVERVQVVACGSELGKGFSELNDPSDQRARMEEQLKLREAGDKEAQRLDEDFLEALEHGMPPTAGFGFSERLFSILVDKPVRETTYFPLMRPK
ncbi:MAG: lysine--tRNA ligase [Patescibacteria group bacterium]